MVLCEHTDAGGSQVTKTSEVLRSQVLQVENKTIKLDTAFHMLHDKFKQLEEDSTRMYNVIENVDNVRKNNLRFKGLKEGVEGGNLKERLETFLTGYLRSDSEAEIKLNF